MTIAAANFKHGMLGFDAITNEVSRIKAHRITYLVFDMAQMDPVGLRIIGTGGNDTSADPRATPALDVLQETFTSCRAQLDPHRPYFIAYDFGYYNAQGCFRSLVILISYIPEDVCFRQKIVFASNVAILQASFGVPLHVALHDISEFTYDHIKTECANLKRL